MLVRVELWGVEVNSAGYAHTMERSSTISAGLRSVLKAVECCTCRTLLVLIEVFASAGAESMVMTL